MLHISQAVRAKVLQIHGLERTAAAKHIRHGGDVGSVKAGNVQIIKLMALIEHARH